MTAMPDNNESDTASCFGCCVCLLAFVSTVALCIKIWNWGVS